jgi:integrase
MLRPFIAAFDGKCLNGITTSEVSAVILKMTQDGVAPSTMKVSIHILAAVFRFAVAEKMIEATPVNLDRLPKIRVGQSERVAFTEAQYQRMLEVSRNAKKYHSFWPSAIIIGWNTGLRKGDVACLEWDKIDFGERIIRVWPKKKEAFNERLTIPMSKELDEHLRALLNNCAYPEHALVLPDMKTWWIEYDSSGKIGYGPELRREFRAIATEAGCPRMVFHCLRHAFVTRLLEADVHPIVIASMTGHSLDQLQNYAHVSLDKKRRALEQASG